MNKYLSSYILNKKYKLDIKNIIKNALDEDIKRGDITGEYLLNNNDISKAKIIAKEDAILCGIDIMKECFHMVDKNIKFKKLKNDGDKVKKNEVICELYGKTKNILKTERTALNFLQHLSGISTLTNKMVKIASKYGVKILDTRKTLPGLRILQKYAVRVGGGENHRFNLSDEILIKENHIFANDGIENSIKKLKKRYKKKFEIEVENLEELKTALQLKAPIILLDNFKISDIKKAVKITQKKALLEVSGGVTLKKIKKIAKTGINYISVGQITHSVISSDFSLIIEKKIN